MRSRPHLPSKRAVHDRLQKTVSRILNRFGKPVPTTRREAAGTLAFLLVLTTVGLTGYLQGTMTIAVATPAVLGVGTVVVLQAVIACLTVTGLFGLSVLTLFGQVALTSSDRRPTSGHTVTAVVPVYNDAAVLHRSLESLLACRYDDLAVILVAEPDDEASISRARQYAEEYDRVSVLVNTANPGSKAGAINYAAEETDTAYLAVFDADERVDPEFVSAAVGKLDDCDIVQGRTIPEPDGVIETIAYYESVVLGDLSQRLLTLVTDFTMAASRTVVMRRSAFESVNGYDPSMLTEDYDFAFECYEADLDVVEDFSHTSTIEGAHTLTDWWGQRKRWMTGYAQVLHSLVRGCRAPRTYRSVLSPLLCAGSVLGNLFMFSLISKAVVLVVNGISSWLVLPVVTLCASALAMRAYDLRAGNLDTIGTGWLITPVLLPLYSLVGIKAVVEYVFTWDGGWYSVTKGI